MCAPDAGQTLGDESETRCLTDATRSAAYDDSAHDSADVSAIVSEDGAGGLANALRQGRRQARVTAGMRGDAPKDFSLSSGGLTALQQQHSLGLGEDGTRNTMRDSVQGHASSAGSSAESTRTLAIGNANDASSKSTSKNTRDSPSKSTRAKSSCPQPVMPTPVLPTPVMTRTTPSPSAMKRGGAGIGGGGGGGGGSAGASRGGRGMLSTRGPGVPRSPTKTPSLIPFPLTAAAATGEGTPISSQPISSQQPPSPSKQRPPRPPAADSPRICDEKQLARDACAPRMKRSSVGCAPPHLPADSVWGDSDLDAASVGSSPSPFQTARSSIDWGAETWEGTGEEREEESLITSERGVEAAGMTVETHRVDGKEEGRDMDGEGGRMGGETGGEAGIVLSATYPFMIEGMQLDRFSPLPLQACVSLLPSERSGAWAMCARSLALADLEKCMLL